jgi:hypothetical protein
LLERNLVCQIGKINLHRSKLLPGFAVEDAEFHVGLLFEVYGDAFVRRKEPRHSDRIDAQGRTARRNVPFQHLKFHTDGVSTEAKVDFKFIPKLQQSCSCTEC